MVLKPIQIIEYMAILNGISRHPNPIDSFLFNLFIHLKATEYNECDEADYEANQVSPDIHRLVVDFKDRPQYTLPSRVVNTIPSLDVLVGY